MNLFPSALSDGDAAHPMEIFKPAVFTSIIASSPPITRIDKIICIRMLSKASDNVEQKRKTKRNTRYF
jgi:hypothetical protein